MTQQPQDPATLPEVQETEAEQKPKHIYQMRYRLLKEGVVLEEDGAHSEVCEDRLLLIPDQGARFDLTYRDILKVEAKDYTLSLSLKGGEEAQLFYLGRDYDSYVSNFFQEYNKIVKKDSFMAEAAACVKKGARFAHTKGECIEEGACDICFGETAVILQKTGEPVRIPYALIRDTEYTDYSMRFVMDGQSYEISMLGNRYDACKKAYMEKLAALMQQTADAIRQAKKDITPVALRAAAKLFLDGRAVGREEAGAVCKGLWEAVYQISATYGASDYFDYLQKVAKDMRLGFKKALVGEQDYLWMLALLDGKIIMEAASPDKTGRATYIFKAGADAQETMSAINYCMHMCEFRREPIYMSEAELNKDENIRYKEALRRVPELLTLRALYSKRVAHTSFEKWKENL
jgi:hypothetical protein